MLWQVHIPGSRSPDARVRLQVLQSQTVDQQDIKIKPSTPTATFLEWYETHGRKQKAPEAKEDGEAPADDDSREMEATEAVMDLVSQREGRGGSGRAGSGRGGRGSSETAALISGVAKDVRRCALFWMDPLCETTCHCV